MDPKLQALATQTEQPLNRLPTKPHHFLTTKVVILALCFLLTAVASSFGTLYVMQKEKPFLAEKHKTPPVTNHAVATPTPLQSSFPSVMPPTPTQSASNAASPTPQQVCTLEAKVCPDGSTVGRTGPNCSFAPCPN
jgi:hypothetical protein